MRGRYSSHGDSALTGGRREGERGSAARPRMLTSGRADEGGPERVELVGDDPGGAGRDEGRIRPGR
jgi:hypothetical protein